MAIPDTTKLKIQRHREAPLRARKPFNRELLKQTADALMLAYNYVADGYLSRFYSGYTSQILYYPDTTVPLTPYPYIGPDHAAGEVIPDGLFQCFQTTEGSYTDDKTSNTTLYDRKFTTETQGKSMEICVERNTQAAVTKFNVAMAANKTYLQLQPADGTHIWHNGVPSGFAYKYLHSWIAGQKSGTIAIGRLTSATALDGDLAICGALLRAHERAVAGELYWRDGLTTVQSSIYLEEALLIMADIATYCIQNVNGKLIFADSAGSPPDAEHAERFSTNTTYFRPMYFAMFAEVDPDPVRAAGWLQLRDNYWDLITTAAMFTTYNCVCSWYFVYRATNEIQLIFTDASGNEGNGFSLERVRLFEYVLQDYVRNNEPRGLEYIANQTWLQKVWRDPNGTGTQYDRNLVDRNTYSANRLTYSCLLAHLAIVAPEDVLSAYEDTLMNQIATTADYISYPHDPVDQGFILGNLYWTAQYLYKLVQEALPSSSLIKDSDINKTSNFAAFNLAATFGNPTAGDQVYVEIPRNCTVTGWTIKAPTSCSAVVGVWSDTYANDPPTSADSVAGSEKPTLSSATKAQDLTLTTWTKDLVKDNGLIFNLDSLTGTPARIVVTLHCRPR